MHDRRIRLFWFAVSALFGLHAHATSGPRALDEQNALALSPDADTAYGVDLRGRHITEDVRELTAKFAREGFSPPGGTLIPDSTHLSIDQKARVLVLFEYWALYPALTVNESVWRDFLRRNQLPDSTTHSAAVLAAEAALRARFTTGPMSRQWTDLGQHLLAAYIDERDQWVRDVGLNTSAQPRSSACPPAASKLSPTASPKLDRAPRSLAEFYPQEARRLGEAGRVIIELQITATGCASNALLRGSSGFPDLDAAAMKFYETLSFLPAQQTGGAVSSTVALPIKFKLDGVGTR